MDIVVFQQYGSAEKKTEGIMEYGEGIVISAEYSINESFSEVVDNPEDYICNDFSGDLVLNFLKHPDLSDYLVELCEQKGIPVVTTGKPGKGYTPFTCCGLGMSEKLGIYGAQFGFPEYRVDVEDECISHIEVIRGAPCGATWGALENVIGMPIADVYTNLPLQVQQNCYADPSSFDPISGKSPVHYAAYVHLAALKKAVEKAVSLQKSK